MARTRETKPRERLKGHLQGEDQKGHGGHGIRDEIPEVALAGREHEGAEISIHEEGNQA